MLDSFIREYEEEYDASLSQFTAIELDKERYLRFRILSARGFLIKMLDKKMILTSGSGKYDRDFLNEIMLHFNIGHVNSELNQEIEGFRIYEDSMGTWFRGDLSSNYPKNFGELFTRHRPDEAYEPDKECKWQWFRRRSKGPIIECRILEPFIARMVKGVSAVGITTTQSCDGHGQVKNKPWILTSGNFNTAWFRVLMEDFVKPKFDISYEGLIKFSNSPMNLGDLYIEINRAADVIYLNRTRLQEIKMNMVSSISKGNDITNRQLNNMSEEELVELFSNYFKKQQHNLINDYEKLWEKYWLDHPKILADEE